MSFPECHSVRAGPGHWLKWRSACPLPSELSMRSPSQPKNSSKGRDLGSEQPNFLWLCRYLWLHCQLIWEMSWTVLFQSKVLTPFLTPSAWHAFPQNISFHNSLMKWSCWGTQLFCMHEFAHHHLSYSQLLRGFLGSRRFTVGRGKQGFRAKCFPETHCLGRLVLLLKSSSMAICLHSFIK